MTQELDAALQPPMVITDPGPEYAGDTRPFQGIPGVARAPKGRLWATWYGGGPDEGPWNYVLLCTSGDDGATWADPQLVIDCPGDVRAFDPCLWLDPTGRLWLFWAQGWTLWDGRAGVWSITTDQPDSESPEWSAPRRLCNGVMMNKPTVLSTGDWVLPAAVWSTGPIRCEPANERPLPDESGSNVVVSTDQGETWQLRGGVDIEGRACDEHMVVEKRNGDLWLLARTRAGIGESISTDGGRTWAPSRPSAIAHVPAARFFIRRLASGSLLLVKHSPPDNKTRSHLTAYLSEDDGGTWLGGLVIDERPGVSYPDGIQAPDGTIRIIYDYSRTGAKRIFTVTFTEADVLAGGELTERVVVNRASGTAER